MHVADNYDKGGNKTQVRFFNKGSNLHSVWDSLIVEHKSQDEEEWLRVINSLATALNVSQWSKGTPEDWATESLQAAKEAYCLPGTKTVMQSVISCEPLVQWRAELKLTASISGKSAMASLHKSHLSEVVKSGSQNMAFIFLIGFAKVRWNRVLYK
jgi:hypothetical protein